MSERVTASVGLLDWHGEPVRVIQSADWKLEDRDDSTNRLFVTTSLAEAEGVQTDLELTYDQRRFLVAEVDRDRATDTAVIAADEVQAELASIVMPEFIVGAWTAEQAVEAALEGTRWQVGEVQGTRYGRANFEDITVLEALQFLARHQDARLSFDSLNRRVNVLPEAGTVHEHVFTYGRELKNIEKDEQAPTTTVIYPTGKDDMGIESVNDGQSFVADFGYYVAQGLASSVAAARYWKVDYWEDNRYEVAENLLRDAEKRLAEEAYPQITYTLTASATRAVEGDDDFDLTTIHLGDQVYVWDQEIDAKLRAEVTAVTTSSDASENELVLSYLPDSLGASVEGRYFGDSGRPNDGRWGSVIPRSGFQPRPSMPILESINDLGVGLFRWNGQDHQGNTDTIPERFGHIRTIAALLVDGEVPSPNSSTAFGGTTISHYAGGTCTVSFGVPGDYAIWFQMVGADGETVSEFSEPLVVGVEALVDTEAIRQELVEAQERIDQAQQELDEAMERVNDLAEEWENVDFPALQQELEDAQQAVADAQERLDQAEQDMADSAQKIELAEGRLDAAEQAVSDTQGNLQHLQEVTLPQLEQNLEGAVSGVQDSLAAFQQDWDENWDPEAIGELRGRQDTLEGDIVTGLGQVSDDLQEFRDEWDENWEPGAFDELRNRADTLEGNLADGLTQAHNQAEALAEAARDDAVNQAAANAQSEYDRLQEIAERALSRAGDNVLEDPSFETGYWFDYFENVGSRTYTPTSVHRTGDQAMEISDGNNFWMNFDTLDVEEGESWRFTIWYRTSGSPSMGNTRLALRDQVGGSMLADSDVFTVSENEFRRAVVTYTVPPGIDQLVPGLIPQFSNGELIVDDIAFQEVGAAAEALRMAEVARQEAEAAHIAAGEATDTAALAYDAASSKNSIHWSLSAPSGTAESTDDVWWQYELRNGRRVVIGQWFWDNGVWRETEIAEEWLPQVNIGTGTYGDLHGDRLTANSVKTNHLLVGPRNIITDLNFAEVNEGSIEDGWGSITGGWELTGTSWSDRPMARISTAAAAEDAIKTLHYGGSGPSTASLPCEPGETFKVRFQIIQYTGFSNDDDYRAQFRWTDANGSGIGWSTFQFGGEGYGNQGWAEFEATAPEGAAYFYFRFAKYGVAAGRRGVGNVSLEKMAGSDLIVQGAVKAEHVDSASLTASDAFLDHAMVNLIQGRMANFDQALIGGTLLKDRSITTQHLTIADTTDFAPDPVDYVAAWDFVRARAVANTAAFEGAAIALDNTSTSDSGARGPILPVHPGDEIYVGAQIGWSGSAPTSGRVYLRMEWFEDATSSRETFTNVVSTTEASGWFEGTTTVPDYATHARFYIYTPSNSDTPGVRRIRSSKVRVKTGGELIVDGSIKSPQIDTLELTSSQAFIDLLDTNLLRARLLEADTARITGDALVEGTVSASKLAILPDTVDFAPDPSEFPELWNLAGATLITNPTADNPSGVRFSFGRRSGTTEIRGPLRPVTQGQRIYFKGRHGFNNGATTNQVSVRMEWFATTATGVSNRLSFSTFATVPAGSGGVDVEGTVVVPEGAAYANLYFYQASSSGGNAAINGTIHCEPQVSGVLIEDGSISANHIVAESVAGAVARFITLEAENVIATLLQASNAEFQDVVARVATLIELNASRITAGTISTARLNVSDLAAQIANIIQLNADRITAGTLNANRININSLFANSGFISSLRSRVIEAIQLTTERIITGDIIAAGTIDVSHINVTQQLTAAIGQFLTVEAGHIAANAIDGMTIRGAVLSGGTVRGGLIETTQASVREIKIDGRGIHGYSNTGTRNFHVNTAGELTAQNATIDGHILAQSARLIGELRVGTSSGGGGEGGIIPSDNQSRIRLVGRMPSSANATDMFTTGYTPYRNFGSVSSGRGAGQLGVNYAQPVPTGSRVPTVTANMDETWLGARPGMIANTRSRSSSSFVILWALDVFNEPNNPRMSFSYFATWGVLIPS